MLTDINLPLLVPDEKNNFGGSNLFWNLENDDVTCNPRIMPKIPEISVGIQMERSVSVSSDLNIRDHLWRWSTHFGQNIPTEISSSIFDKPVLYPQGIREFKMTRAISIGWPDLIGKCRPIFLRYSH